MADTEITAMTEYRKATGLRDWFDQRLGLSTLTRVLLTEYWIPKNINYLWAAGMVLAVLFVLLVVSGLFLLMYYKPDAKLAFDSVNQTIMHEVAFGWLFRHIHAVAASVIFLVIYIHMLTGIYYGSYKRGREVIWVTGMLLLVLFSVAGFSGYVLPWGQLSYWATTVVTNIFGSIPFVGNDLLVWIRGDYSVADATLTRFFMLHVVLIPFSIAGLIVFHFYTLRFPHVNNQEGAPIDFEHQAIAYKEGDRHASQVIPFWPVFMAKDLLVVCLFLLFFFYLVFYQYEFALDPVNFDRADYLKTPGHIYPEWYFLWSYETLRGWFFDIAGIKAKMLGLMAFGFANVIFFLVPWLDRSPVVRPASQRPYFRIWYWLLVADLVVLTIFGKLPPEGIREWVGFYASAIFLTLFFALPFISSMEARRQTGGHG